MYWYFIVGYRPKGVCSTCGSPGKDVLAFVEYAGTKREDAVVALQNKDTCSGLLFGLFVVTDAFSFSRDWNNAPGNQAEQISKDSSAAVEEDYSRRCVAAAVSLYTDGRIPETVIPALVPAPSSPATEVKS